MTVIGAICAMITMFLTMFGFVAPMMTKLAPKISSVMIDANKENLQTIVRAVSDAAKSEQNNADVKDDEVESMFCHNCGQKIAKDSVYCKHCGAKQ